MVSSTGGIALGAAITSAALTLTGVYHWLTVDRLIGMLFVIGSVVLVGAIIAHSIAAKLSKVNRPADVAFHEGYDMGYDKGWLEGRRIGMPTVVQLATNELQPTGDTRL